MIRCNTCRKYTTYSDAFGVAAMKVHVVRCARGEATDTEQIPVIEAEPVCSRCNIRLNAVPSKPVAHTTGTYHQVCYEIMELEWAQSHCSSPGSRLDTVPLKAPLV